MTDIRSMWIWVWLLPWGSSCSHLESVIEHAIEIKYEQRSNDLTATAAHTEKMAIIVNLDVMLAKRKRRLGDLAEAVGISIQNLSVLKTGKARAIRFSTLSAICKELNCQPGDILEYVPGETPDDSAE